MLLLPPTSTLIYPPFPNTTLVRSGLGRTGRRPGRLRLCCLPARCGSWVFLRVGGAHGIAGLAPSLLRNCDGEVGPLGGAEEAAGHLFERVRGGPLPRAQLARCFAGDVAEGAAERAQAVPAGLQCDVEDGHVRVAQQRGGAFDPTREQVAVRRHAEGILERAREVRCGDVAHACQSLYRRSEGGCVGKACVSRGRSRWWPDLIKK